MVHVRRSRPKLLAALLGLLMTTGLPATALAQSPGQQNSGQQASGQISGLKYRIPAGWTSSTAAGALILTPTGLAAGEVVSVRFFPDVQATANFAGWFATHVANNSREITGQRTAPAQRTRTDEGDEALVQMVIGTVNGQARFRYFLAVQRGKRVVAAHYTASSLDLLEKYQPGLDQFLSSVDVVDGAPPTAASAPATPARAPGPPGSSAGAGGKLPAVPAVSTVTFVASGRDPEKEPIPDEFHCYAEVRGSDFSRSPLTLQILEGRQYRLGAGDQVLGTGRFTPVRETLNKLRWDSGPLAGTDAAYLNFGDHGQSVSLQNVGPEDRETDFECYQRGPREAYTRLTFGLRTPKAGKYACVLINTEGKTGPPLEILPGNRYRVGGQEGQYRLDILSDQNEDTGDLDFVSGPWAEDSGFYREAGNGRRTLTVSRRAECSVAAKPTPLPRYGKAKAPAPPAGSGGLTGAYASWTSDPFGHCGGLCWSFYVFFKNGYVYTDDPETGLEDADCTRTHPNGLPVCQTYTLKNGQLNIGTGEPEALRKKPDGDYALGGTTLTAIRPVAGLKLSGEYRSFSASSSLSGMTSSFSEAFLRFTPDGRFSREASGGFSATFTDTGTASGTTTGGVSGSSNRKNSGTYRFVGSSVEFRYGDGTVERYFAFLPDTQGGKPDPSFIRIGGRSYSRQDK